MAELFATALFSVGYLAISLEHRLFVNKAATSLILAVALWMVAFFFMPLEVVQLFMSASSAEIFSIVIFLMSSMTLVEILLHYRLFDVIEHWLRSRGWTYYRLGWAIAIITFVFSAFLANLTTTIVALQIARRLFPREYLLAIGGISVIASNAGGAFSPIGDVTTLMLWFAEKFTATEVIVQGILPSIVLGLVSTYLLLRSMPREICGRQDTERPYARLSRSDRAIIISTLLAFFLPLGATWFHLPPYMGLLAGLGLVWLLIDIAKKARPQKSHLQADIKRFLQQTDIESIQFFVGILLAVSALHTLGILDHAAELLFGTDPTFLRTIGAFVGLGAGSAIVDNVPLTAAAISSLTGISSQLWVFLAIMVGTGGSLLIIGSASGIVAMGMLPELTFARYLRIATVPALLGFAAAAATWLLQSYLFF